MGQGLSPREADMRLGRERWGAGTNRLMMQIVTLQEGWREPDREGEIHFKAGRGGEWAVGGRRALTCGHFQ